MAWECGQAILVVLINQFLITPDPTEWTEHQVYRWAEWTLQEFGLTSVNLPALRGINGHQLCSFDHQQFLQLGINPGDAIYLQECLDVFKGGKQLSAKPSPKFVICGHIFYCNIELVGSGDQAKQMITITSKIDNKI